MPARTHRSVAGPVGVGVVIESPCLGKCMHSDSIMSVGVGVAAFVRLERD
jgi:hypothetical protein